MKCDSNLLEDYIEGFLKDSQQQKMEAHLQYCKNCQSEYEQLVNEQKTLFAQLNKLMMTHSQADFIMQRIQTNTKRKKSWNSLKITVISAAVIVLSFALYYWNRTPYQEAQQIDEPTQLAEANSEQIDLPTVEPVPRLNEPFLDVSIDEVVENGDNVNIHFRVKFKDEYQQYYNNLYEQIRTRYQYKESADQLHPDHTQDDFYDKMKPRIQFAIRNEVGQLIISTKSLEGEQPMINTSSSSGREADVLGEMIYTTSVPSHTKPATFEVLTMEANLFDLYETEVNAAQLKPFQFENATYIIDTLEIKQDTLHLQISTEGEPEVRAESWEMVINDRLIVSDRTTVDFINNRTVYKLQFDGHKQIPSTFKLVPDTAKIKKQIDPIVLDLD
ncbi:hypothetical protein AM499_05050 [Bacillus sp. FJAT-22090]|uniref:zf-HC2 domain-containing protein n=1 Tax=Bacillus sp. FJAT-22090 TaxID=1581038 RepID=UPI0006ADE208|nr:zf-HC2 domain-containing protein [Bacillus sp. FJAT-22090]ALC85254.1 hypothetical protein AM499_05050 [Bacillus sp. FJAT-22090]